MDMNVAQTTGAANEERIEMALALNLPRVRRYRHRSHFDGDEC